MERQFHSWDDPRMIGPQPRPSRSRRAADLPRPSSEVRFVPKTVRFRAYTIFQKRISCETSSINCSQLLPNDGSFYQMMTAFDNFYHMMTSNDNSDKFYTTKQIPSSIFDSTLPDFDGYLSSRSCEH